MEIVLLIALVIVTIMALALSPMARRNGDASDAETGVTARGGDRRRFKRWPNGRGLR
jgi:hypothetical protein